MKKLLILAGIFFVVLVFSAGSALAAAGHKRINEAELRTMISEPAGLVIVDVREPWRFKKGHIAGAVNIPYDNAKKRVLKELPKTKSIVFVCHGGPMGDTLGRILTKNGYQRVYNLKRGMRGWSGPLEK